MSRRYVKIPPGIDKLRFLRDKRSRRGADVFTPPVALTFDDISLAPQDISRSRSRLDENIDLRSQISPSITLYLPVIASYMHTVCEWEMATGIARLGGIGIIHRLMSIEDQMAQVEKVKRQESRIIEEPYTITPDASVGEIKERMRELGVGAFLVVSEKRELLGIVSTRDVDLEQDNSLIARDVMTPRDKLVVGSKSISTDEAIRKLKEHRLEKLPLVDEDNVVRGLFSKKSHQRMENRLAVRDNDGRLVVGVSIGLREQDAIERVATARDAGADWIVLSIANGYLERAVNLVQTLRSKFSDIDLAAGVVAEQNGARRLFRAGADTVLVGIGSGSICVTRRKTGVGIPQFTSLRRAALAARKEGKFIISDGGIYEPHHLVKALFAGASATIIGSRLAGTDESPGRVVWQDGRHMKQTQGLASNAAKLILSSLDGRNDEDYEKDLWQDVYMHIEAEGVESALVPLRGSTKDVVKELTGGLRSTMTYMGVTDIKGLWRRCDEGKYVRVTDAGDKEGKPHDLSDIQT